MLYASYPFYLANRPESPNEDLEVTDKYSGELATRVALAGRDDIDRAIAAAVEAAEPMRRLPPYERQAVLNHCVRRFTERADELALALCIEAIGLLAGDILPPTKRTLVGGSRFGKSPNRLAHPLMRRVKNTLRLCDWCHGRGVDPLVRRRRRSGL